MGLPASLSRFYCIPRPSSSIKRWRSKATATICRAGWKLSPQMESFHGSTRPDRRTIERNRRIQMKALCSRLDSLLPSPPTSREGATLPLPDRLDEAVNYIRSLQGKLERMKERKRRLMESEGTSRGMGSVERGGMILPQIEVQDLGSGLRVVIISSPGDRLMFYEAVRVLEEEGGEILNANFLVVGDKAFHSIHSMVADPRGGSEASKVLGRLKKACHPCW